MACSLEEIRNSGLAKVRSIVYGQSSTMSEYNGVHRYDLTKSEKIDSKPRAHQALVKKQASVAEWAKGLGFERYGSWTVLRDLGDNYGLEIRIPPLLEKAYKTKIANDGMSVVDRIQVNEQAGEFVYGGTVYPSFEDMDLAMRRDMDFLPSSGSNGYTTNFADYINFKKALLVKVESRLGTLEAKRKYESTKALRQEITRVRDISKRLNREVAELLNTDDIFDKTMSVFNSDIALISNLLSGPRPLIEDIHTAEQLMSYFQLISNYSSTNRANKFVDVSDPGKIDPVIRKKLDDLASRMNDFETQIQRVKEGYLLDLIESSPKIRSLFPEQQAKEILDEMLADKDDIGIVSQFFGTVDKSFSGQDSLLAQIIRNELDRSRGTNKSYAAQQAQRMDALVPKVRRILLGMGYGISWKPFNSLFSEVSYDPFYQRTTNGNRTGRLIQPLSNEWFRRQANFLRGNTQSYWDAIHNQRWQDMDKSLVDKYNWVNDNANFLDISKIPELSQDPRFSNLSHEFAPDPQYRENLIRELGQYGYDRLVEDQAEKLEDWLDATIHEVSKVLDSHGVQSISDVPVNIQHILNITLVRNNPFTFLKAHKSGQESRVNYENGSSSAQYYSHMKYNNFYPKRQVERVNPQTGAKISVDSGYYDAEFDVIKNNPDLLEFWGVLNDSVVFMNRTLSDSSRMVVHNSLPAMRKFTTDILLSKEMGVATKFSTLLSHTRDTIGKLFSTNIRKFDAKDVDSINNSNIQHIQDRVGIRYRTELLKLQQEYESEPIPDRVKRDLMEETTHAVAMEQSFNLPVVIKAYLDMVAEYKAQRESLPKLSVLKNLYEGIEKVKNEGTGDQGQQSVWNSVMSLIRQRGVQDKRVRANTKLDHFYNKNVMNLEDGVYWLKFGKFYDSEQQKLKEAIETELGRLEKLQPSSPVEADNIGAQVIELQGALENLGRTYTLAETYNVVVNKLRIFFGLAFNLSTNIFNWFQGWYAGMVNDTGKYWTAGNFAVASSFVNKLAYRHALGNNKYKHEFKKAQLMMDKLQIIQDATNEIDRARNSSGFTGIAKKVSPYYLIEYTEWHNQTPQILSVLMDKTITDVNGNTVQVFTGEEFPAHMVDVDTGELVLRPEFDTPQNRATWQDFSSPQSNDNKTYMSNVIGILNGDYSRTGSTYIKGNPMGKTLMTFKTWLPNQIWQRFAYDQKNLSLGMERFDGVYSGTYLSPKTTAASAGLLATGAIAAGLLGMGMAMGPLIAVAAIGGSVYVGHKAKAGGEELHIAAQLSQTALALAKRMVGIPVNTLSGKQIIKQHEFGKLGLSPQEKHNLMTLVSEIGTLLSIALVKVLIKAMGGPNDDDEPKTMAGGIPNPYYGKEGKSEEDKQFYNWVENSITRILADMSLYRDPMAMFETMTSTPLQSWLTRVQALNNAVRMWSQGLDTLSSGPNQGESRLLNEMQRTFLPSMGQKGLGFESSMQRDFNPNEQVDSWFYTDYKKDRKKQRATRKLESEKLTDYWKKQYNYDALPPEDQAVLDDFIQKKVREEIKYSQPYNDRSNYGPDQMRLEP